MAEDYGLSKSRGLMTRHGGANLQAQLFGRLRREGVEGLPDYYTKFKPIMGNLRFSQNKSNLKCDWDLSPW